MMVTRATLAQDLAALGVPSGAPLMVHASLRKIGPIAGGAHALLDALFDVLGPESALVMPLGAPDDEPFEAMRSPAHPEMGALAEVFRRRPGTLVNDHAAARFAAAGRDAQVLLLPVPLHDYHGPGSVLQRFTDRGGSVLRLGADVDTVTLTHWAEYRAQIPNKRRVRRRYRRADGRVQWIDSLDDSDGIVDWDGGDYFAQILLDFLAAGHARRGRVGNGSAELLPGPAFVDFAVAWLEAHFPAPRA